MKHQLNCDIIRDLIPLDSEGLCSEEAAKAVREHIEQCESCRLLRENLPDVPSPDAANVPVPDEGKAFRKVRRKMKRSRLGTILLSIALAAVVLPVGYLTVGQVMKIQEVQSFSTVWQSIEVRQMVKALTEGDMETYQKMMTWMDMTEINSMEVQITDMYTLHEQDVKNIGETYAAAYGDAKVKNIDVKSQHVGLYSMEDNTSIDTQVVIQYEDGRQLSMEVVRDVDGLFSVYVLQQAEHPKADAFEYAVNYADYHEPVPYGWFEMLLETKGEPANEKRLNFMMPGVLDRFDDAYDAQVEEAVTAFYKKGYEVDNCIMELCYDEEREQLYQDFILTAHDAQGSAVMQTRLYQTYLGMIPPTADMVTVHTDGCTEALAEDVAKIFG